MPGGDWEGDGSAAGAARATVAHMSLTNRKRTTVTLAALALAATSSACGGDAPPLRETQATPSTGTPAIEQAIARRLDGLYTASIDERVLRAAMPGTSVPAGLWALRIDVAGHTVRLIPPEGGDITIRLVTVAGARLRLAPDTACESRAGRTAGTRLAWHRTTTLLRLETVRAPCRSDATVLTSSPWRAAWPTTPLTPNAQPVDAN